MNRAEIINAAFKKLRYNGIVRSLREFAKLLDVNEGTISKALKGEDGYLSDIMMSRVNALMISKFGEDGQVWDPDTKADETEKETQERVTLPVLPTEAMAGTLGEFAASIQGYECERMISPIKGVDYAIKVSGDSMSPEIPNGSQILIKKIWEEEFIEWGKIFCLDTRNGAVIKRVYPTDDPEEVECRSINPDYPPFRVKCKCINGWYRVMMVLALK